MQIYTPKSSEVRPRSSDYGGMEKAFKEGWLKWYDYAGAIHIHSIYSDGTGSIPEIAYFARQAGLHYLIVTDHNTLLSREEGQEGWYGNTLLLIGEEVSSPFHKEHNHYMAFGHEECLSRVERGDLRLSLGKIKERGAISFIAHPFSRGNLRFSKRSASWQDWEVNSYTGMEVWSYMHDWFESLRWGNFLDLCRNPAKGILGPRPEAVAKWDRLNLERRVVGIGGMDIHAKRFLLGPKILPYDYVFRTIRTHILTPLPFAHNLKHDRNSVYEALRSGHCYFAYDLVSDSSGFTFSATNGRCEATMGDEIAFAPYGDITLKVSSPARAKIRLIRNGELIRQTDSDYLSESIIDDGVYRIEAYYRGTPWVYTNPIYVRPCENESQVFHVSSQSESRS